MQKQEQSGRTKLALVAAILSIFLSHGADAQNINAGEIRGVVTDSGGAAGRSAPFGASALIRHAISAQPIAPAIINSCGSIRRFLRCIRASLGDTILLPFQAIGNYTPCGRAGNRPLLFSRLACEACIGV